MDKIIDPLTHKRIIKSQLPQSFAKIKETQRKNKTLKTKFSTQMAYNTPNKMVKC